MASGVRGAVGKEVCSLCSPKQVTAVTSCKGCLKGFCRKHFNEHRDELSQDLQSIFDQHDRLLQELQVKIDHASRPSKSNSARAILKQITEWEITTIKLISEAADEARADVEQLFSRKLQLGQLKQIMSRITEELKERQESESFVEIDINNWTKQIKQLKTDLDRPSTFETNPLLFEMENFDQRILIQIRPPVRTNRSQIGTACRSPFIECPICYDQVSPNQMERMFLCDHICCLGCAKRYYRDCIKRITNAESLNMLLCSFERGELLDNIKWDFLQYLETKFNKWFRGEKQVLDQYHNNLCTALRDSHYKKCGNPRCSEFFYVDDNNRIAQIQCSSCKFQQCQKCCRKWYNEHTSMDCEKYSEWLENNDPDDPKTRLIRCLNTNCTMCPNKQCGAINEYQAGGSEHYNCHKCKTDFCPICSALFYNPSRKIVCPRPNCPQKTAFHGHCYFNCFREIRDAEPEEIIQLLTAHHINIQEELRKKPRATGLNCPVAGCSKAASVACEKRFCDICYKEFLCLFVWRSQIEPWELYTENRLRQMLLKASVTVPQNATKPVLIALAQQHLAQYLGKPQRITLPK